MKKKNKQAKKKKKEKWKGEKGNAMPEGVLSPLFFGQLSP